jgi:tripartite-type tricarboxylate transporter receptor subunit TctC
MRRITLALLVLVILPWPAAAADYPTKPIELIVPWPAGGRTGLIARLYAAVASRHLGQQMVVVNKPGGGGAVGTTFVAQAPADGYTLLAATVGGNVMRPLTASVPYTYDSFAPIGQITASTLVLAARSDRPWKGLTDLVADAKRRPSPITFSTVFGVVPHVAMEAFAERAGIALKIVPQAGDAPGVTAVLGGHVDMIIAAPGPLLPHIKAGSLRALTTFNDARDPVLADVPTAKEQGYPIVATPWTGIVAPKGTAAEALAKLRATFAGVLADPEFVAGMQKLGEHILPLEPAAFAARWKQDHEQYEKPARAFRKQ